MSLEPNRRDIERHIGLLTAPWIKAGLNALMEIRCLNENGAKRHRNLILVTMDFWMMQSLKR